MTGDEPGCTITTSGKCITFMMYGLRTDEAREIIAGTLPACESCQAEARRILS